nr:spermatogenesis-associated protein 31D1-like [Microcebus murinus]
MECALPFLKGRIELWLSLTSDALGVEPQVLLLSALGLLSLSLLLLVTRRSFSYAGGERSPKGRQLYQRRAKEERSLISFVTSPWAKDRDPMSFRQLLCPDPLCNMCNDTPAEILKVLFRPSWRMPLLRVIPPCPPPPSSAPLPGYSTRTLGDAPPVPALHSKFPVHSSPPQPRASPLLPPHHTGRGFSSTNRDHVVYKDHLCICHPVEPGNCSFFNPDVLSSLERQVEKRRDFLMWKEKEKKTGSLPRKLKSDHQVNSSANTSASVADEHDTAVSPHLGTSRDKPEELQAHQQHLHPETIEAASVQSSPSIHPTARPITCTSARQALPKLTLVGQSSKADVPVSVLPGDFPLSSELRKTLEHHLRKRLIQHRWGLPRRVRESLSLLNPPSDAPETPKAKCTLWTLVDLLL